MTTIRQYQEDGSFIDRPKTEEELLQEEQDHAKWAEEQALIAEQNARKADLLQRLGITEEEARLLLA